jgi:hypothetical protein
MLRSKDGISTDLRSKLRRLEEVSWNFDRARSRSAFSAVHFHPGRFISQLPSILISLFSDPGETILDPFCGSGTTLVEAQRLSRRSIGIDINPISVLISQAKTLPISEADTSRILRGYFSSFIRGREYSRELDAPPAVQLKKWYSASVAADLKWLFHNANATRDQNARILKLFCFSSILMKATRETRHWGYICDNTEPKDRPNRDVAAILEQTIEEIRLAYFERDKFDEIGSRSIPKVYLGSAAHSDKFISECSVDLIVTSPPYFGVVDYVKAQRLSMEWFEYEIEPYRSQETGARSKRHRKTASSEFEAELEAAFKASSKALKPGRLCTVVFGASEARSFRETRLVHIVESAGLEFVYDVNRDISIQRRQKPSILSECVYIFRKPLVDLISK